MSNKPPRVDGFPYLLARRATSGLALPLLQDELGTHEADGTRTPPRAGVRAGPVCKENQSPR